MKASPKKLLIFVNVDWFFLSHRLELARAAIKSGYKVYLLTEDTGHSKEVEKYGIKFLSININRSSINIFNEFLLILKVVKIYLNIKPNIVHHVALKSIFIGTIASVVTGVPQVKLNALTGMGYIFINNNPVNYILRCVVLLVMRIASYNNFITVFQNSSDMLYMIKKNIVSNTQSFLIKGAGVNIHKFKYRTDSRVKRVQFLLASRMLYDKGVVEYIAASRLILKEYNGSLKFRFILAGPVDYFNKKAINKHDLLAMVNNNTIVWYNELTNDRIAKLMQSVNVVVLPSYHEGLPKVLIEAGAIGRPIVCTDVPGCNEIITNGVNGFLVPPRDHVELARKMLLLAEDHNLRKRMGENARKLFEKNFTSEIIINQTLSLYKKVLLVE